MRPFLTASLLAALIAAPAGLLGGCTKHVAHHERTSRDLSGDVKKTTTDVYETPDGGHRVEKSTIKVDD